MAAIEQQVGGNHYKEMDYQPFEFAMDVGGTPAICKVAKYLTRVKGDRLENLRKAYHCIQLEQEYLASPKGKELYMGATEPCELDDIDKAFIKKFCDQFQQGAVYKTVLECTLSNKHSKAMENLTKFVKYMRWEYI